MTKQGSDIRVWVYGAAICVAITGCAELTEEIGPAPATETLVEAPEEVATKEEEAAGPALSGALGTTIATLGAANEQGMWLKTPLVNRTQPGRITYKGKSAPVTLIPLEGPKTAGSRVSLQAMVTLGIPLTDLAEVSVTAL